jgi:hypothetical protein
LPTVLTLLLVRRWFFARTYLEVGLQIIIGLIPYALGLAWAVWTGRIWKVQRELQKRTPDEVSVSLISSLQEKI